MAASTNKKRNNNHRQQIGAMKKSGLRQKSELYKGACIKKDESNYQRNLDLPSLIPLWPKEIDDHSLKGTANILAKIRKALRYERKRGQSGHWSYNLNKHAALVRAEEEECRKLKKLTREI